MKKVSRVKRPQKASFRRWLLHYFRSSWLGLIVLALLSVVVVGFQLLEPWPLKILIDSVFGTTPLPSFLSSFKHTDQLILLVALSIIFIYGVETLIAFIKNHFTNWLGLRLDYKISSDFFDRVQHLSLTRLGKESSGDYSYRQNSETGAVSGLLIDIPDEFFIAGLTIVGITIVMIHLNFQLSAIGFIIIPLLYVSIRLFSKRIERQATRVEESNSRLYGYSTENVENVKLIQSFGKEKSRLKSFQSLLHLNIRFKLRYSLTDEGFTLTNDTLATVAMAVLVVLGAHKVINGQLTVGDLLIFLTYLSDLYSPLQSISETIGNSKVNIASSKRVYSIFADDNVVKETPNPIHVDRLKGSVQLRNVSFSYKDQPILQNINLDIPAGQRVALIGSSGSGKTTLLSLLPRFYDFQSGEILIDGIDITKLELKSLRRQFAIVTQEAPLLSSTVAQNLGLALEEGFPSEHELLTATKAANAYDFIQQLPHGFNTVLGERGGNISGGQRQRIAIARAFLRNAPILLLDEPTSALDAASEAAVVNALATLMANRTTLIVSHNGGTLRNADTIYVMDNGRITDRVDRTETARFHNLIENTKESN